MSLQSQPNRARADSRGSNVSNVSAHSKLSNASSLISKTSSKASGYARAMFHPRSTTHSVAEMVNLQPGDLCETVSLVTVRQAVTLDSASIAELPTGTTLEVLEIGEGRRIKVKSENDGTGWISSKTRSNMPLVAKSNFDISSVIEDFFEAGGEHEVLSTVTVRQEESLDSMIVTELKRGTRIEIVKMGTENKRRAKIQVQDIGEGWISVCTKWGEVLLSSAIKVRVIQLSAQRPKTGGPRQRAALWCPTILATSMGGNELASYRLSPKQRVADLRNALAKDLGTPALALLVATTGQLLDESNNEQLLSEVFNETCRQN